MALSHEIHDGIKTYLWEVASQLGAMSAASRTEILSNVESHVYEALASRSETPAVEDLQAVLSSMPAPESYADESVRTAGGRYGRLTWSDVPQALVDVGKRFIGWVQEFAWEGIVGPLLALLACGILLRGALLLTMGLAYNSAVNAMPLPVRIGSIGISVAGLGILLLVLGTAVLLAAWAVGWHGIKRIRTSQPSLRGFAGAYAAFIVPLILLITVLVVVCLDACLEAAGFVPLVHEFTLVVFVLAVATDYFLVKYRLSPTRLRECGKPQSQD